MNKKVELSIKNNSYVVDFPNAGQLVDIEFLKSTLSKGMYGSMMASRTVDSNFALDVIDTDAYMRILVPSLIKDLKIDSIKELSIEDMMELIKAFKNDLVPFIKQWRDLIREHYEELVKETNPEPEG
jgi:hypothetical protein